MPPPTLELGFMCPFAALSSPRGPGMTGQGWVKKAGVKKVEGPGNKRKKQQNHAQRNFWLQVTVYMLAAVGRHGL